MIQFFRMSIAALALMIGVSSTLSAQNEQQTEKEFYESIDSQVNRLTDLLELNDAQIFYVDSILVHDYGAMQAELKEMQDKKVSNPDLYYDIQFKWQDQVYYSFQKIFDEDQWARYLKSGAERDKKNRDKKRAKAGK